MKYISQDQWTKEHLRFWRVEGKWHCAVPRDDIATKNGFDWKNYGLIGRGDTKQAAIEDWENWKRCSDFVASIY
jgi:hypothetical protein